MDKSIPRQNVHDTLYIDSAFRRDRDRVHDYNVYFESNDMHSARRLKDVVAIDVMSAHIPVRNNNILEGMNSFDIHILKSNDKVSSIMYNVSGFQEEMDAIFKSAFVDGSISVSSTVETVQVSDGVVERYAKLHLTSTARVLLCQTEPFPAFDSERHANTLYTLLVSPSVTQSSSPLLLDDNGDFASPLTFNIMRQWSVPVQLQPGYYQSDSAMVNQLWSSIQYIDTNASGFPEPSLSFSDPDPDVDNVGWTSRRDPQARRSLYFKTSVTATAYSHIVLTKRRHANGFDLLSQLGLHYETAGDSWDEQVAVEDPSRHAFFMKSYDVTDITESDSITLERVDEQIEMGGNVKRIFELRFGVINLIPRRYVNVIVEQIPRAGCKMTNNNTSNVVCRIDLTSSHFLQYSTSTDVSGNGAREGTSNNAFTTFTRRGPPDTSFFEPITLKGINIKLRDNLGLDYDNTIDHTLELRITRIGDATSPFHAPIHDVSSLGPDGRRTLPELVEDVEHRKRRGGRRARPRVEPVETVEHPNPIYRWGEDNKWAVLGTLTTFFGTLYASSYFTRPRQQIAADP